MHSDALRRNTLRIGQVYTLKHPLDFRSEIDRLPLRVRSPASKLDDAYLTSGPRTTGTIARKGHVGSVQLAKRRFLEMRGSLRSTPPPRKRKDGWNNAASSGRDELNPEDWVRRLTQIVGE
jgi:hypothetical protein